MNEFDIDSVEKFEDMYEGHFETATDFAEYYCTEVEERNKKLTCLGRVNYETIWELELSKDYVEIDCYGEHTYGHIFKKEVN